MNNRFKSTIAEKPDEPPIIPNDNLFEVIIAEKPDEPLIIPNDNLFEVIIAEKPDEPLIIPNDIVFARWNSISFRLPAEFVAQVCGQSRDRFLRHLQTFADENAHIFWPKIEDAKVRLTFDTEDLWLFTGDHTTVTGTLSGYDYSKIGPILDSNQISNFLTKYLANIGYPLREVANDRFPVTKGIVETQRAIATVSGNFPPDLRLPQRLLATSHNVLLNLLGKRRSTLDTLNASLTSQRGTCLPSAVSSYRIFETLRLGASELAKFYRRMPEEEGGVSKSQ